MIFRTEIQLPPPPVAISLSSEIISIGSCFADAMGRRLAQLKLPVTKNPFGVIYNPISILSLINTCLQNPEHGFEAAGYLEREGYWYHDQMHTSIHADSKIALQKMLSSLTKDISQALKTAHWLIITPGTAHVYLYKENDRLVANCHKLPGKSFKRHMLTISEITSMFATTYQLLKKLNPGLKILLTVSPVRHIKDTLQVNAVSKSTLLLAANQLQQTFEDVHYFPSYEIMLDDLRDYRFYQRDMIHPSDEAEDYIWSRFSDTYFTDELKAFEKQWTKISKSLSHRPFMQHSEKHQAFLRKILTQLENLAHKIDVEDEIQLVKQQMI
ncbi:MAG: GSCFA domain-containing protein [Bacteroidota bacterium]